MARGDTVLTVEEPTTVLAFLLEKFPGKGRNKVKGLLTHRQVFVNGLAVTRHDHPLEPGHEVTIRTGTAVMKDSMHGVRIMYEDSDVVVIDKPPGLLSIASEGEQERTAYRVVTEYVRKVNREERVFIVHRLDKDTSGIMMFAKNERVKQALQENWKDVVVERIYSVVVEGQLREKTGTVKSWLQESKTKTMYVSPKEGEGQLAVSHYTVGKESKEFSRLEVQLETGRKNQIRVHMRSLGHPVVGDKRYGSKLNPLGRLGLHARVLSFRHPTTGEVLRFETQLPYGFRRLFGEN